MTARRVSPIVGVVRRRGHTGRLGWDAQGWDATLIPSDLQAARFLKTLGVG
jgi:hypothetical protein